MERKERPIIVVASRNKGKITEFAAMFDRIGYEVKGLHDYPEVPDVIEDGDTFRDNAYKKASEVAEALNVPVLADDSGVCIDALDGAPGVYSARYAGEPSSDENNNAKMLKELQARGSRVEGTSFLSRAEYVCVLAYVDPIRELKLDTEGRCEGWITPEPKGEGGFGYDPYFYLESFGKTMAELTMEQKNEISHRAIALRDMVKLIRKAYD
ncbi:XTP/dITP diphosphatase [Marinicrinis lubricantis]|uniref:dITP/XTP pyrophosphatase n=1 Tax=Marinicrinis lubricantis TaxID=2086470 RepID=A0ABW1IV94_9BACL